MGHTTEAVSALLETVFRSLAPQQASLLRLFLLLESREQGGKGWGFTIDKSMDLFKGKITGYTHIS
jgi:hypothetical protein